MRAVNFMGLLIENPKLDAKIFSAKGYGNLNRSLQMTPKKEEEKQTR